MRQHGCSRPLLTAAVQKAATEVIILIAQLQTQEPPRTCHVLQVHACSCFSTGCAARPATRMCPLYQHTAIPARLCQAKCSAWALWLRSRHLTAALPALPSLGASRGRVSTTDPVCSKTMPWLHPAQPSLPSCPWARQSRAFVGRPRGRVPDAIHRRRVPGKRRIMALPRWHNASRCASDAPPATMSRFRLRMMTPVTARGTPAATSDRTRATSQPWFATHHHPTTATTRQSCQGCAGINLHRSCPRHDTVRLLLSFLNGAYAQGALCWCWCWYRGDPLHGTTFPALLLHTLLLLPSPQRCTCSAHAQSTPHTAPRSAGTPSWHA
jgi:hypothetical protein